MKAMKKYLFFVFFALFVSLNLFSIGLTFGPLANEKYLIENGGQFPISFYDFPLFIGGIYHKINFTEKAFYYIDLAFDIHNSNLPVYSNESYSTGNNTTSYLFYLHSDINYFPFEQKRVYIGAGIELIVVYRAFSKEAAQLVNQNFYITPDYFCYIDCGINIPVGKIETGFKMIYRLLPFTINETIGKGEITFLIGLKL